MTDHSPDQIAAIEMAIRCILADEPCLIMGRAGTGKTTTLRGLIERINSLGLPYRLCAFTNKAADVMRKKLDMDESQVTTSHRLLYQTEMVVRIGSYEFPNKLGKKILKELATKGSDLEFTSDAMMDMLSNEMILDGVGASDDSIKKETLARIDDLRAAYKKIDYGEEAKTSRIDNPNPHEIIIVDEVSMLPCEDKDAILDTFKRVVFVGDYRQLPPVTGPDTIVDLMKTLPGHAQAELTKVFRSGDVILQLAARAEDGKNLDGKTIRRQEFVDQINRGAKLILGTNKMVFNANMAARRLTGIEGPPKAGISLVCSDSPRLKNEPLMMYRRAKAFIPSYQKGDHDLLLKLNTSGSGGMIVYDAWPTKKVDGKNVIDDRFGKKRDIRNAKIMRMEREEFESTIFFIKKYVSFQKNVEVTQNGRAFKYDDGSETNTAVIPLKYGDTTAYLPTINFWSMSFEQWERARADGSLSVFFSYAITCHKSQGSEYDYVVFQPKAWGDDKERLNYTGITRAKKEVIVARNFQL